MNLRTANRKNDPFGQTIAREEIRAHLLQQNVSLRWLASRIGLQGHGSLSRFLAAKQQLPFETILALCRELGVEGQPLQRLIDAFALPALPTQRQPAVRRAIAAAVPQPGARERDTRFFLNERVPYIYDTLRLLRRATISELATALHKRWRFQALDIATCLEGLTRLRLVQAEGETWSVVDRAHDIVIPSKYSNEVGKRSVRYALQMQQAFLEEETANRMIRSVLTTLKIKKGSSWREALGPRLVGWQDELLALQGDSDDVVLNVVIGVTEVAHRN